MEKRNLCGRPWRTNPRRHREAERLQNQRWRPGHHSEAKETYPPLLGPHDGCPAPFSLGLRHLIGGHVAMESQDMHDHVFRHHGIATWRLQFAEWDLRQFWMSDE